MATQFKITPSVIERVSHFVSFYNGFKVRTIKLSDIYSSRSTNYASIYNTDLFVINTDKGAIEASGYSKSCKAIITLNMNNNDVQSIIEKLKAEHIKAEKSKAEAKELFEQQKLEAKQWIEANPEIVAAEAAKVATKFQRDITNIAEFPSKMKQQLAWFLLNNFSNNTKTAIFHAL